MVMRTDRVDDKRSVDKRQGRVVAAFDTARHDDTVLESVAHHYGFLDRIRRQPVLGWMYRFLVGLVGVVVAIAGLIMVLAPGPGWLVVFAGLAILATEFSWAKRLLDYGRAKFAAWMQWVSLRPLWLRCLIGLFGMIFLVCLLLGSLYLSGWRGFPFTLVSSS